MHFIAMMGFTIQDAPIHYDKPMTYASLAVAVVMVGVGIFIVGYRGATGTALFTGGTITGLGIASMHYLGMAGMSFNGTLEYNTFTVGASVAIAWWPPPPPCGPRDRSGASCGAWAPASSWGSP